VTIGIGKLLIYILIFSGVHHNKMAVVSHLLFLTGLKAISAKPSEPEFYIWSTAKLQQGHAIGFRDFKMAKYFPASPRTSSSGI
jgi:uncharacterized membrane protein